MVVRVQVLAFDRTISACYNDLPRLCPASTRTAGVLQLTARVCVSVEIYLFVGGF